MGGLHTQRKPTLTQRPSMPLDADTRWLIEQSREFRRLLDNGTRFTPDTANTFFTRPTDELAATPGA